MTQTIRASLVGAYYRPPAAALLKRLPLGAPLRIVPEPDNPHDANALAVHLATADFPQWAAIGLEDECKFTQELAGFGFSIEDVHRAESFHLGYIARQVAAQHVGTINLAIAEQHGEPDYFPAKLSFAPDGKPQVVMEV